MIFLILDDRGSKDKDRRGSASSNKNKPPRYRDDRRSGRSDRYDRYDNSRDGGSRHYSENRKRRDDVKPSSRGGDKYDEPRSSGTKSSNSNKDTDKDSPRQSEKQQSGSSASSSSQKDASIVVKKDTTVDKEREKELEQERYRRNWVSKE